MPMATTASTSVVPEAEESTLIPVCQSNTDADEARQGLAGFAKELWDS
jgi:hypothetical protein